MKGAFSIITVGLSPAWDVTCTGEGLSWGQHKLVSSTGPQPAGKALNISRALAWMGERSIAAGLWGKDDYQQLMKTLSAADGLKELIKVKVTPVDGRTRLNITVVDATKSREMHLRSKSDLASKRTLQQLKADLQTIADRNSICIFAGLMPEGNLLKDVIEIMRACSSQGAKIALDTSGNALKEIVNTGLIYLVKPNVEELRQLLDEQISDTAFALTEAAKVLLDKVEIVLISRGPKGAVVVTRQGAWQARAVDSGKDRTGRSTVGCGDYLLAGFLKGLKDKPDPACSLKTAIKVATAKAWGWTGKRKWQQVLKKIKVEFGQLS